MKLTQRQQSFLGLDPKSAKTLDALARAGSINVLALSKRVNLPRTTAGFLLKGLERRGLAERVRVANHHEWRQRDEAEISERIKETMRGLLPSASAGMIAGKDLTIEVFNSGDNVTALAKRILTFSKNDRVYYIQSLHSATHQMKTISGEFMESYHRKIKEKKIVMETVCSRSILDIFKRLSVRELSSHYGRLIVAYVVPDRFIDFPADIMIYRDTVIIMDYERGTMTRIKNTLIAAIFLHLFELIKTFSERIDLNAYIGKLMKE